MPLATVPGIKRHPFPIAASSSRPALVFCFSRLSLVCRYVKNPGSLMIPFSQAHRRNP
jgi:hypothetical protein